MAAVTSGVLIIFAGLIVLSTAAQTQREIEIKVSPDGSYWIGFRVNWLQTEYWLKSGPLMVRNNDKVYTTEDGSLTLQPGSFNEVANTKMGPVRRYSWTWVTSDNSLEVSTTIEMYYQPPAHPYPNWYYYRGSNERMSFELSINSGLNNTQGSPDEILASFPSFIPTDSQNTRGWMTYSGGSELYQYERAFVHLLYLCEHWCRRTCKLCVCTTQRQKRVVSLAYPYLLTMAALLYIATHQ